jgi:hypothetical protein
MQTTDFMSTDYALYTYVYTQGVHAQVEHTRCSCTQGVHTQVELQWFERELERRSKVHETDEQCMRKEVC